MNNFKTVQVVGAGYIGLPLAVTLASCEVRVYALDINEMVVSCINAGKAHIEEKGIDELLKTVIGQGRLTADTVPQKADVHIIAVPTPVKKNKTGLPQPDTTYVFNAIADISKVLNPNDLIIIESTCPVGTTEEVAKLIKKLRNDLFVAGIDDACDKSIKIAFCPERIIPGDMMHELKHNERIVGGLDSVSSDRAFDFYNIFVSGQCIKTTSKTAEMVKLAENTYRDVNIAYANELSIICDKLQINVWDVIKFSNYHPRVNILNPGPGVGGHCIAVDPWFVISAAPKIANVIRSARTVNLNKAKWVIEKILFSVPKNEKIALFGLTYKPDVDDFRESPALDIAHAISKALGRENVLCVDPFIDNLSAQIAGSLNLHKQVDIAYSAKHWVMLVGHSQFNSLIHYDEIDMFDVCGFWR